MSIANSEYTVRDCAHAILGVIDKFDGSNEAQLRDGLRESLQRLLARPDLLMLGIPREGNHITNSQYLYYDGQLSMTLDQFPKGTRIPPHDHGTWEALAVYRGSFKHTVYERTDDGSVPGHAELKVIDDRVLEFRDLAMVVPPSEIHSFTALSDDTYAITIVGGHYKDNRTYYNPEQKTYLIRNPKLSRPKR
jgi:predicted metal-dependent enzyme (double-stranded beta helix superfamily)